MNILEDQERDVESCKVWKVKNKSFTLLIEEYVSFVDTSKVVRFVGIYQNRSWNWKSFSDDESFLLYFLELKVIAREEYAKT